MRQKHLLPSVLAVLLLIATGCGCDHTMAQVTDLFARQDCSPPVLLGFGATDASTLYFEFDEPIVQSSVSVETDRIPVADLRCADRTLSVSLSSPMELGSSCLVGARVEDEVGNSTRFSVTVWAKNPHPASLLINEFSTKGTDSNPDRVELVATASGNIAGITVSNGTGTNWTDRCILPDQELWQGEYIVIAFQKEKEPKADYRSQRQEGLSSNNGCLVVSLTPATDSPILDAVVYGNHTTTTHEGFGSAALKESVSSLAAHRMWDNPTSEGSVDSTHTTATRTFCRYRRTDTNGSGDWYVTKTRGSTFGAKNSEERYEI